MKIQVLVAAMNRKPDELLDKLNIQSDVIVGNQCDENQIKTFRYNNHEVKWLSFAERGVGLNRNNCLMRADADICLFSDDDMVYEDGYKEIVQQAFQQNPDADVLIFNLREAVQTRPVIMKKVRVSWYNYLRYGTARIAVKLKPIKENGIYFNQCFGGGTEHCHGEDNLFLTSCLKSKLKIYAIPNYIATLTEERASSWDNGIDEKYITDQGFLYYCISKRWWKLLCLQDVIRHRVQYENIGNWYEVYKLMKKR